MIKLDYAVNPKDPVNGVMEVELHILAIHQDMPEVFKIGVKSWGYDGLDDPVLFFDAYDGSGRPLASVKLDTHCWRVTTGSTDRLKLHYILQLPSHYPGHQDSFMEASRAFILGRQIFITPEGDDSTDITVQFRVPPDWGISVPWQGKYNKRILRSAGDLAGSFFALGDYLTKQVSVDKGQITVAVSAELRCTPSCLANFIRDVLLEQAKVFHANVEETRLFIFNRGDRGCGGTPGWGSMSLSITSDYTDEMILAPKSVSGMLPDLIISHEVFHIWPMGHHAGHQPFWFTEGFTNFYAYLTLCRLKLATQSGFYEYLRQENKKLTHAKREQYLSLDEASSLFFKEERARNICYRKGMLFAFILDVEIRRLTDGRKNIDVFMRRMSDDFGTGTRGYCNEDMVRLLDDITGQDMSSLFDDYIYGTRVIDLEDLLRYDSEEI